MTIPFLPSPTFARLQPSAGRVRLLASVMDANEARQAVAAGVDIVDAKDPRLGALGALDETALAAIRQVVPPHIPLSATTGDLPCENIDGIRAAIARVAECGADYVKIAVFTLRETKTAGADEVARLLRALAGDPHAHGRRVAVLLADHAPDLDIIAALPAAGFAGVMLDTADKARGALPDVADPAMLRDFLERARRAGLFAGLAGALRLRHIGMMTALQPDILGFRGALCEGCERTGLIALTAVRALQSELAKAARDAMIETADAV